MKKNSRKTPEATKKAKERKETPAAPVLALVKSAKEKKPKGSKFNGDWTTIPSSRQLLALVIRSIESGVPMGLPTTREAARIALGYEVKEDVAKAG